MRSRWQVMWKQKHGMETLTQNTKLHNSVARAHQTPCTHTLLHSCCASVYAAAGEIFEYVVRARDVDPFERTRIYFTGSNRVGFEYVVARIQRPINPDQLARTYLQMQPHLELHL